MDGVKRRNHPGNDRRPRGNISIVQQSLCGGDALLHHHGVVEIKGELLTLDPNGL